jgi:hypothetical protein
VATTGSSAIAQLTTPAPASAIRSVSPRLTAPVPREMASAKTVQVRAACTMGMTRLQEAPSAYCDDDATTASTPQMSQVPRCGLVAPRRMSRT